MNTDTAEHIIVKEPNPVPPPQNETPQSPLGGIVKKWILLLLLVVVGVIVATRFLPKGTNQVTEKSGDAPLTVKPTVIPSPVHDYPAVMKLVASSSSVRVNDRVTIKVVISAPSKSLDGADSIISYNPQLFDAVITQTTGFPSYLKKKVDTIKGKIFLTGVTFDAKPAPLTQDLTFAEISFKAKKPGKGVLVIEFQKGDKSLSTVMENGTSYSLLGNVENVTITVIP